MPSQTKFSNCPALCGALQRGLTQEDLARDSNIAVSTIHRLEKGLHSPTHTTLGLLSEALATSAASFFSRAELQEFLRSHEPVDGGDSKDDEECGSMVGGQAGSGRAFLKADYDRYLCLPKVHAGESFQITCTCRSDWCGPVSATFAEELAGYGLECGRSLSWSSEVHLADVDPTDRSGNPVDVPVIRSMRLYASGDIAVTLLDLNGPTTVTALARTIYGRVIDENGHWLGASDLDQCYKDLTGFVVDKIVEVNPR